MSSFSPNDLSSEPPLVTVAMVTYNSAQYVAQAIESVLCQSYTNLELLVCDDASTDATWEIVQRYHDPRIRAVRNAHNRGEYANRNQAAQLARGEYLIYIDGDDILYAHGLEFMVRMLHAFPCAAMALARPWSEKFVYPVELTPRQFYQAEFLSEGVIAINFAHLLLRTEVLRAVGGFDTSVKSGDSWIQLLIGRDHNSLLISNGLAWWRRTPGQASERMLQDHTGLVEGLLYRREFLQHPQCPLSTREVQMVLSNLYGGLLRVVLRYALRGKGNHGLRLLRQAQVPRSTWRNLLTPPRYPAFSDVDARNPLTAGQARSPFARGLPLAQGETILSQNAPTSKVSQT